MLPRLRVFLCALAAATTSFGRASAQAFSSGFESSGASGGVFALTTYDDGSGPAMIAAGTFEAAGTAVAGGIARWNGVTNSWTSLGTGVSAGTLDGGHVSALTTFDPDGTGPLPPGLVAAGDFTTIDGVSANHVASWNGTAWTPLGAGTDRPILALAIYDDDGAGPRGAALYAGGRFEHAGGVLARSIARWNGATWEPLSNGVAGPVSSLAAFDPDGAGPAPEELVAGGFFESAGSVSAARIARWNGLAWQALGGGVTGSVSRAAVNALAVLDLDGSGPGPASLFVGGSFTIAGGVPANGIARWNGATFSALGSGIGAAGSFPNVRALGAFDEDGAGPLPARLFVAGLFKSAGGITATPNALDPQPLLTVARWDGASWAALGVGLTNHANDIGRALVSFDDDADGSASVIVGGQFTTAGDAAASGVARWSGTSWEALGTGLGMGGNVHALAASNSVGGPLYAGGDFTTAGTTIARRVARYDDASATWSALGSGFDARVRALALDGTTLIAGGDFTRSGAVPMAHVAAFDGTTWNTLGGGTDGPVHALARFQGASVAGGDFARAGLTAVANLASFDGAGWNALGAGLDGTVRALEVFDDGSGPSLFAGGDFTRSGTAPPMPGVARWDGITWSPLGDGLCCGGVHNLAVFDDGAHGPRLFAAGDIDLDQNGRVDGICRWNPSLLAWENVGAGVSGGDPTLVRALTPAVIGGAPYLVVGGSFATIDAIVARNVARFDGTSWSPFGAGVDSDVHAACALAAQGGPALFLGGTFRVADGIPSAFLARDH